LLFRVRTNEWAMTGRDSLLAEMLAKPLDRTKVRVLAARDAGTRGRTPIGPL